jgi:hypothetical protein
VPWDATNPVAIVQQPASPVETSTGSKLAPVDDAYECHVPHDCCVDGEVNKQQLRTVTPMKCPWKPTWDLLKHNKAVQCLFFEGCTACITLRDCERSVPVVLQLTVTVITRFIDRVSRVASLQVDSPRYVYALPVWFKKQEELQSIMMCDCPAGEQYWKDLSGWKPESMTPSGKC